MPAVMQVPIGPPYRGAIDVAELIAESFPAQGINPVPRTPRTPLAYGGIGV